MRWDGTYCLMAKVRLGICTMSGPIPQAEERRKSERQQIGPYLLRIDPCDGRQTITCFVWDMSEGGARLKLAENAPLPNVISVLIGNVTRPARVVWRKDDQIGIEFLEID